MFPNPLNRPWLNGLVWFLSPQYKNRLRGFLLRVAVAGVAFGFSLWGVMVSLHTSLQLLYLVLPGLIISGLGLGFTVGSKTRTIYGALNRMRASLRSTYRQPLAYPEINLADVPGALQDPAVRKVSAEITALGGQHYKDITIEPVPAGHSWIRLYLFPEEATVTKRGGAGKIRLFPVG